MTGTAGSLRLTGRGHGQLPAMLDLQPTASGAWTPTGLSVLLPSAGIYQLDATVRSAMTAVSPVNTFTVARLFDVTAGAVVPGSEVIVQQISVTASAGAVSHGYNNTAPIQVEHVVTGPRTVRLEAARFNASGASQTARVVSDASGRTTLRWNRIA
ncbi:hypothetical protein ACIBEJ_00470 [Nonomuraea sp. NPDC050790]|uniref:hypothetical protein n=1 Tax=Nonomuraea sp. NPDC050790 TaxID=3364371 RepID=UPI0037A2F21C